MLSAMMMLRRFCICPQVTGAAPQLSITIQYSAHLQPIAQQLSARHDRITPEIDLLVRLPASLALYLQEDRAAGLLSSDGAGLLTASRL
jgi:hypothetical protein